MKRSMLFTFVFLLCSFVFSNIFAQEEKNNKKDSDNIITKSPKGIDGTTAVNDKVTFKDGATTLIEINSEGTAGSLILPSVGSTLTGTKLYNNGGNLFWGNSQIGLAGGGVSELNDLSDAKSNGTSLFLGNNSGSNNDGTNNQNTAVGTSAFTSNTTGSFNTAVGRSALTSNTIGNYNAANGYRALYSNTTGNYNVGIGYSANRLNQAGSSNTMIGYEAGRGPTTHDKSGNVFIGYRSGFNETGNDKLYIENSNSATPLIYGEFDNDLVKINGDFNVTGNITVADDAGIFGLDQVIGFNDLRFYGDPTGGPDLYIGPNGQSGFNANYSNVSLNVRGISGDTWYFRVEDPTGTSLFDVFSSGNVSVTNNLSKGGGSFKIDHPLDPTNKNLYHSFVESPDMMNVYNGNTILDGNGEAIVTMADWFEALNKEFRYQLTCIGGFAPVYIAEKINGNQFKISGGSAGMEVSWQVTGVRQDAYANENRIQVEEFKNPEESGRYLHPTAFGQPKEMSISYGNKLKRQEVK